MLAPSLPGFATLARQLSADTERTIGRLRAQAAIVRSLMDHIPRLAHTDYADGLREQLTEEKSRLARLQDEASVASLPAARDIRVQLERLASATESSSSDGLSRRDARCE